MACRFDRRKMHKNYSPVRIKNPTNKNCVVRLLTDQKLHVIFDKKEFLEYRLDISGSYLSVDDISEIANGWMATVSQNSKFTFFDNTVLLGSVNIYDNQNVLTSSLCVLSKNDNDDYLRIINPDNINCNLEPNQILDVVFYTDERLQRWSAFPAGKNLCLELIQHTVRTSRESSCGAFEHLFRFRFNSRSVEFISEQPFGKYEGGQVYFLNNKNEKSTIKITCSWRGKSSIYKALLLPRMPVGNSVVAIKKKKQFLKSDVILKKMVSTEIDFGCNVLMSRV
jgi:hypothetical protein